MDIHLRVVALVLMVSAVACTAERTTKPKPPDPAEPVTLMAARGKLLFYEPFSKPGWETTMRLSKCEATLVDGQVRIGEHPGGGHPPQLNHYASVTDLVVQVRVRLEGARRLGVQVSSPERKQNMCSVMLSADRLTISHMSGWGGTTKVRDLVSKPFKADPQRWYTLLVEWSGSECLARLDDQLLLHAEDPDLAATKGQVALQSSGSFAWYDDIRIWNATGDPAWAKCKAEVLAAARKP